MQELAEAFARTGIALRDCAAAFNKFAYVITPAIKIFAMPHSRTKHLALYGRKARTRKKNIKRLLRG